MAKYKKSYKNSRRNNSNGNTFSEQIDDQVSSLEQRIKEEAPESGYVPPLKQIVAFRALPISDLTLKGLEEGDKRKKFITMTPIQNACIPQALAGRDILGAARTGSGKTLAFLIPLMERLFRARISRLDGPAAIVLSPTRELALQIFQVLLKIGSSHLFSAGIVVGGKKEFHLEQAKIGRTNIIIATPGRLLQHLEQTPDFDVGGLLMLVLDEADRILDMGFRDQLLRILEYLPTSVKNGGTRQTLLFSATQTKRVADLAALSLYRPEYIGVHDKESSSTPETLEQSFVVVPLENKLDAVFSFVKSHLKKKSIIFFSTCSQVRYVLELFSSLQPGVPLMALHGKLSQERRTKIYMDFIQRPHAVLFSTDLAARGLDFPNVDWVVQADAPEDKDMYIHRVGRTARYNAGGKALLMLLPSEHQAMTELLDKAKVPIKKLSINPSKTMTVSQRSSSIVASNPVLHLLAKKAFKSYTRSIYLMPDKDIFQVNSLPFDAFAVSLGLAATPTLKFLKDVKGREDLRSKKNVNLKLHRLKEQIKAEKLQQKIQNLNTSKITKRCRVDEEDSSLEGDDLLVVKKAHILNKKTEDYEIELPAIETFKSTKKIRIDGSSGINKRIIFNDDGEEEDTMTNLLKKATIPSSEYSDLADSNKEFIDRIKVRLKDSRLQDKLEESRRIKEKHKKRKLKEKGSKNDDSDLDDEDCIRVTLGNPGSSIVEKEINTDGSEEESESEESGSVDESSDDEIDSEDKYDCTDVQEETALALIRGAR